MYTDLDFMSIALRLAKRNLGNVFPNPSVGCIIVKNNTIVGRGWTQKGGRPHAESMALLEAQSRAINSTAYITLEPCSHYGKTEPCALQLIKNGIKKVIIPCQDPDERVSGRGIKILKESGIEVINGILETEAKELNKGFFYSKIFNRPLITGKIATSLDGKIALSGGKSKWITNDLTRRWVHKLRSEYDAIMIGSNTLLKDNPHLTCRLEGLEDRSPVRVIIDRSQKLKQDHNIAKTAHIIPTYVVTNMLPAQQINHIKYLIIENKNTEESFLIKTVKKLSEIGITRLLLEGGSTLFTQMLKEKLLDRIVWCRSNKILGNDSIPAIKDLNITQLNNNYFYKKKYSINFNEDTIDIFDLIIT